MDHWLYRCFDADQSLLYVGVTSVGMRRFKAHGQTAEWWPAVASITIEHCISREEVLEREAVVIRAERPRHNVVHNFGRSPYAEGPNVVAVYGARDEHGRRRFPEDRHVDRWVGRLHPELVDQWVVDDVAAYPTGTWRVQMRHPLDGEYEITGFFAGDTPEEVAAVALEGHRALVRDMCGARP